MGRAKEALEAERDDLAGEAANAVASMENELVLRQETVRRLESRILQLRHSVDTANRRIIDVKQGAVAARAARKEQDIQKRLGRHIARDTSFEEAEDLIARVLKKDDPFEQGQILSEIDAALAEFHELNEEDRHERSRDAG